MLKIGYYISRRIYKKDSYRGNISSTMLKIAISAISVGMIVMLIALCTGLGLQKKIQQNVASFAGHIQLSSMGQTSSFSSTPITTDEDLIKNITKVPKVKHAQEYALRAGIIKTEEDFEGVVIKGVSSDYQWEYFSDFITKGKIPHFGTGEENDSIIISQSIASKLKLYVGKRIKSYFVRDNGSFAIRYFTIAGLYKTGIQEFDEVYTISDIRTVQQLNKWDEDQISGLEIILDHSTDIEKASQSIFLETEGKYSVTSISDTHADMLDWVAMFDINIWVIIAIMTIVCGVNMITVLLILILEKTSFIGLLKSMGAKNTLIRKVFLWNAFYIIIRGLFWGNVIGLGLLLIQKYFGIITLDSATYSVEVVPVYINIWYILALNIAVGAINMIMLVLPSYMIAKINPSTTIKHE